MYLHKDIDISLVHDFQFQKFVTLYLVYIYIAIFNICLFIQVENLNWKTTLAYWWFYHMLMGVNVWHFAKQLQCDAKNHPFYLSTTQQCWNQGLKTSVTT
jgi:hypothetical protein